MISYDKYKLIDEDYLEQNIDKIIRLNEYIPYMLSSGIMPEIYIHPDIYSRWKTSISRKNNKKLAKFYISQKSVHQIFAFDKKICSSSLSELIELLIFLEMHPEFEGIIKDEKYLDEIIDKYETKYKINIVDYINDYDDLKKLLKKLKGA